jgi:hypothetical protein
MGRGLILKRKLINRGLLFPQGPKTSWAYPVLANLSEGYPEFKGRLSTCYAPVRRSTRIAPFALDLHVLGTPPAFVLSQDQTLQRKSIVLCSLASSEDFARVAKVSDLDTQMNCSYPQNFLGLLSSFQRASGQTAELLFFVRHPNRCSRAALLHHLLPFATGFPFAWLRGFVASGLLRRASSLRGGQYYIGLLELVKPFSTSFLPEAEEACDQVISTWAEPAPYSPVTAVLLTS